MEEVKNKREELPDYVTGFCGMCPKCRSSDSLIFVLKDHTSGRQFFHCMLCNEDFKEGGQA